MLFLTDHPENTRALLPPEAPPERPPERPPETVPEPWRAGDVASLSPPDRQLWELLGRGSQVWTCDVPAAGAGRAVLIDDAPHSQFDAVTAALKNGVALPDRLVCLALAGTGFRGQRNRPWNAVRGNLHLTVHYRVNMPAADAQTGLTMLPAVAAARTVAAVTGGAVSPTIKWVNDILVQGRKVAGVLTATQVQGSNITNVVFGIGMNVQCTPTLPPSPMAAPAGALADFYPAMGCALPLAFQNLLRYLDEGLRLLDDGPRPLYEAYRSLACFIGRRVRIWPEQLPQGAEVGKQAPLAAGRVSELQPDLSLVIEGEPNPVRKGRMELLEEVVR